MKTSPLAIAALTFLGAACSSKAPVRAQTQIVDSTPKNTLKTPESGVSLESLLQLQPTQTRQLARWESEWAARRAAQNAKIAGLQTRLEQAPTSDARRMTSLQRDIDAARRQKRADFEATRLKARQFLPSVQRSQLDSVASDPRFRVRRDALYGLLLAPPENPSAPEPRNFEPQNPEARRNWLEARQRAGLDNRAFNRSGGIGSYGVYGGVGSGGPQAGVYGGYSQGSVGVHGGIGTNGPSVGISIGRVFGLGRR